MIATIENVFWRGAVAVVVVAVLLASTASA